MSNENTGICGALLVFAGLGLDNPMLIIVGTVLCLVALFNGMKP